MQCSAGRWLSPNVHTDDQWPLIPKKLLVWLLFWNVHRDDDWKHCSEYDSSEWNTFSPSAELFACTQDIWWGRNKRGWVPWWWSSWLFIQRWNSQGQSSEGKESNTVVLGTSSTKKNGKMWEFSQVWDSPPLPPVWEPHVCEEKQFMVHFAF